MLDKIINKIIINIKMMKLDLKSSIIFNQSENNKNNLDIIIINEVAKRLNIPYINETVTKYSPNGYVRHNLTELLTKLIDKANGNIELAQKGIILLSDINVLYKLNTSGIQTILNKELPQLITGKCYDILYNGKKIKFDTTNVTIVSSGDFSEINEEQMKSSLSTNKGFKYIGGFQEIIDINNISLNINDHENKKRK